MQYQDVKLELASHFKAFWDNAITVGISGEFGPVVFLERGSNTPYSPKIQWEQVEPLDANDANRNWLRFNSNDTLTRQSSLSGSVAENRKSIYQSVGLVSVQLFFAKSSYSTTVANRTKRICQKAFQGIETTNGIWFRNSTILDLEAESTYFRSNVVAEYIYQSRN